MGLSTTHSRRRQLASLMHHHLFPNRKTATFVACATHRRATLGVEMLKFMETRNLVLQRAPELALSGQFENAQAIAVQLRKDGVDVRLHLSEAYCDWLDELCSRAREGLPSSDHLQGDAIANRH
jgi:hypothetical protein